MNPKLFGQRLRQARENSGLSQEQLANLVSKDQRSISEYERGVRKMPATDLPAFAQALRVSILFFYGDDMGTDDFDRALLEEFHRIASEKKTEAIEIMRLLAALSN